MGLLDVLSKHQQMLFLLPFFAGILCDYFGREGGEHDWLRGVGHIFHLLGGTETELFLGRVPEICTNYLRFGPQNHGKNEGVQP